MPSISFKNMVFYIQVFVDSLCVTNFCKIIITKINIWILEKIFFSFLHIFGKKTEFELRF